MSQPIVITNGQHEIKIYTVRNRYRSVFQLSYYEGGHRRRQTYAKVGDARRQAKIVLTRLAVTRHQTEEVSTADLEGFVIAQQRVAGTGVPLHLCAELFAEAHAMLGGRSLVDAVRFYVGHNPANVTPRTLVELIADFSAHREAMGVATDYVADIRRQLGRLAAAHAGRRLGELTTADLDRWLGAQSWHPITKNNVRKICVTFGNWAKANRYLPTDRPTAFDGMLTYKVPTTKVEIYTPQELRLLLDAVADQRPELLPWLACAAFTGARVSELALLSWENLNFERGFVEIASHKVRTKARRLVPLQDGLRSWLAAVRQTSGPINLYTDPNAALKRVAGEVGVSLKANGFRHSYISYRLAVLQDTSRVALEAGNSPDIIFQHYRELVTPDEAKCWFEPRALNAVGVAPVQVAQSA